MKQTSVIIDIEDEFGFDYPQEFFVQYKETECGVEIHQVSHLQQDVTADMSMDMLNQIQATIESWG